MVTKHLPWQQNGQRFAGKTLRVNYTTQEFNVSLKREPIKTHRATVYMDIYIYMKSMLLRRDETMLRRDANKGDRENGGRTVQSA